MIVEREGNESIQHSRIRTEEVRSLVDELLCVRIASQPANSQSSHAEPIWGRSCPCPMGPSLKERDRYSSEPPGTTGKADAGRNSDDWPSSPHQKTMRLSPAPGFSNVPTLHNWPLHQCGASTWHVLGSPRRAWATYTILVPGSRLSMIGQPSWIASVVCVRVPLPVCYILGRNPTPLPVAVAVAVDRVSILDSPRHSATSTRELSQCIAGGEVSG